MSTPRAAVESRTWRRAAVGVVVAADVVVILAGGATLITFVPFAAGALLLCTLLALRRPGGHAASVLLLVQVLAATVPARVPDEVLDWALAAAVGAAVVSTHLALALLAAWPVRAVLPRATLARWGGQAAVLALVGIGGALLGLAATVTPMGWGPWMAPLALGLLAVLGFTVRASTRRR